MSIQQFGINIGFGSIVQPGHLADAQMSAIISAAAVIAAVDASSAQIIAGIVGVHTAVTQTAFIVDAAFVILPCQHANAIIFSLAIAAHAVVQVTGIIAIAIFHKGPEGQPAGIVGNCFAHTQSEVIAFHIGMRPGIITHTAAAHSAEDRIVLC